MMRSHQEQNQRRSTAPRTRRNASLSFDSLEGRHSMAMMSAMPMMGPMMSPTPVVAPMATPTISGPTAMPTSVSTGMTTGGSALGLGGGTFGISMSSLMIRPTIPRMQTFGFEVNNSVVAATAATPLLFRPRLAQLLHRRPVHRLRPRRHRRSKQWLWSVIMTSNFTNTAVARRITVIRGDDPLMIAGGAGESRSP